ncbi:hypothetical protein evm_011507 [Chilo suppressalis]|nr:hypothetical protein evm_011507 [Chilo suppressalis]
MNSTNLLVFLLALLNIQIMQSSGQSIKNLGVKVGDLRSLKSDLESMPGFEIDQFRYNGFCKKGDLGRYLSKNLRDYIYEGLGHPNDEGVILTIYYDLEADSTEQLDNSLLIRGSTFANQEKSPLDEYFERKHARGRGRNLMDMMRL